MIQQGTFANYDGIIEDINEKENTVKVRIGIFNRFTQIELDYNSIEVFSSEEKKE
jgi:transcriptional antiterminator NusG